MGYGKGTTASFFCPGDLELKVTSLPFLHLFSKANTFYNLPTTQMCFPITGSSPLIGNLLALQTNSLNSIPPVAGARVAQNPSCSEGLGSLHWPPPQACPAWLS